MASGLIEGLYVVGSIALSDWTPHSDIDVVAVVADPSDPDLFTDLESAQSAVRDRVGVSIDGPYVAWGDLVVPAMALQRPWVLDGEYHVDGESFEINPVTWYTLATYGIALRGDDAAGIGVWHNVEERRSWVAGNLDTYWRGVGESLAAGLEVNDEPESLSPSRCEPIPGPSVVTSSLELPTSPSRSSPPSPTTDGRAMSEEPGYGPLAHRYGGFSG